MSDERSIGIAQAAQQQGPLSKDTRTLLLYDANRKSAVIAYILLVFSRLVWRPQFLSWTQGRRHRPGPAHYFRDWMVHLTLLGPGGRFPDSRLGAPGK